MSWTKTNTKRLGITSFFGVFLLSLLTLATIFQPVTSAAFLGDRGLEYGYFYNQWLGGRAWSDVIPGGIPNTADKNTFINFITNKYYNGSQQEKTGAAFIINLQLGNSGAGSNRGLSAADINGWAVRIQQPQVSFSMENYSFTYNSAYDGPTDDDLFYFEPDTRLALVIRFNGAIVSVVKQDCANPLDGNPGIPFAPPQWSASATAGGPASVFPGQTITFNYNIHNNGPDSAPITQYGTRYELYNGGSGLGWANTPGPGDASETLPPGGNITTHKTWSYTVPANYTGNRVCTWISYIPESSSNGGWKESNHFCTTISQPVPTCVPPSILPSTIEPGVPFTVDASVTYQSQQAAFWTHQSGGRIFANVTGPGYNQPQTWAAEPPPGAADMSNVFSFPAPATVGVYTITYGVTGGVIGNKSCSSSIKVAYSPYFRAQGGNILAGAGFGTGCTTAPAKITSWNKYTGAATPYYGSGTDLAVLALGQVTGVVSGNNQNGTASTYAAQAPDILTFANTGASVPNNVSAGIYGGAYGVTNWCMPDYAADAAADPAATPKGSINAIGIDSLAPGDYVFTLTGNQNLGGSGITVPAGVHVTVVITGGLTINGDIKYASYSSLTDIPRLQIFVKGGNIDIRKSVSILTGTFGAQKSAAGVGGRIDTCAEASWTYNNCNGALTFYGAVFADQILMKRMAGTVNDPTTAAEQFIYGPETWLGSNFAVPSTAWQSTTSLAPVL